MTIDSTVQPTSKGPTSKALLALLALIWLVPSWAAGCRDGGNESPGRPADSTSIDITASSSVTLDANAIQFEDATVAAGIDFQHFDPASPLHLIHETMGSGVAWIDYDADGWPDLLCLQGGPVPPATTRAPLAHRLFRNLGGGRFVDVTSHVGLGGGGFEMGAAVGDFDNDGYDDLAITSLGGVSLWRNVGDERTGRRFEDVTRSTALLGTNPHWATSCAWGDLDRDGWLDLYVCNYVETDPKRPLVCRDPVTSIAHACPPTTYPVTTHKLYRNRGDATFEDVSESAGVSQVAAAAGLAVAIIDLDGDGRDDIFVANDMYPAHLFHNQTEQGGPIRLAERARLAGCGLGPNGASMSGMCVEVGDVDGSGRPALFVTNFQAQPNILFLNAGQLLFRESSDISGLGAPSRSKLGFGAAFLDADLDGQLDLAVANGHVYRTAPELLGIPYSQPTQIFRGRGNGTFRDVSFAAGNAVARPRVGRGVARADYDRDGKPDFAMSTVGGPVVLFRNTTSTPHNWIGFRLHGAAGTDNASGIGAVVTIESGGRSLTHFVSGGGSYLSAHEHAFVVGLGNTPQIERVLIRWPSGRTQEFRSLDSRTYWRIRQGTPDAERML